MTTLAEIRKRGYFHDDPWIEEANIISEFPRKKHKENKDATGIEIGCGPRKIYAGAIGVDINPDAKAADVCSSGDDLPFEDESLDYVISSHCIEHFKDAKAAIIEWYRVLKPHGYLVFSCPDAWGFKSTFLLNDDHKFITTPVIMKEIVRLAARDVGGLLLINELRKRPVVNLEKYLFDLMGNAMNGKYLPMAEQGKQEFPWSFFLAYIKAEQTDIF